MSITCRRSEGLQHAPDTVHVAPVPMDDERARELLADLHDNLTASDYDGTADAAILRASIHQDLAALRTQASSYLTDLPTGPGHEKVRKAIVAHLARLDELTDHAASSRSNARLMGLGEQLRVAGAATWKLLSVKTQLAFTEKEGMGILRLMFREYEYAAGLRSVERSLRHDAAGQVRAWIRGSHSASYTRHHWTGMTPDMEDMTHAVHGDLLRALLARRQRLERQLQWAGEGIKLYATCPDKEDPATLGAFSHAVDVARAALDERLACDACLAWLTRTMTTGAMH